MSAAIRIQRAACAVAPTAIRRSRAVLTATSAICALRTACNPTLRRSFSTVDPARPSTPNSSLSARPADLPPPPDLASVPVPEGVAGAGTAATGKIADQASGSSGNDKDKKKRRRIPMWVWISGLAPVVAFQQVYSQQKEETLKRARVDVVSIDRSEVVDFCKKTDFTSADLMGIWGEILRRFSPGVQLTGLTPDQLGEVVQEAITLQDSQFRPYDMMCFYRNYKADKDGRLPLHVLLTGLSLLAQDALPYSPGVGVSDKQPDEPKPAPKDGEAKLNDAQAAVVAAEEKKDRPATYIDFSTKLDLAWKVIDSDDDGLLSLHELQELIGHLTLTGHVEARSLVYTRSVFPPEFDMRKPETIARLYYEDLSLDGRDHISLQQFKRASYSLTRARLFSLWYLQPRGRGPLLLWKDMVTERLRRYMQYHKQAAPVPDIVTPTPAGSTIPGASPTPSVAAAPSVPSVGAPAQPSTIQVVPHAK